MSDPRRRARVLHVISSLSTYGAERFVAALATALDEQSIDVAVLTMYTPRPDVAATFPGRVIDVARSGRTDTGFFVRMVRAMREFGPDIVHTHVHNGKYWGRLAALTARVPALVHTEHNSDFRAHPAVRSANRFLHAKTRRIIAFSRDHAERIARAECVELEKFAIVPNGIELRVPTTARSAMRETLGLDPERAAILHVGRFEMVKNQRLALEAFASSASLRSRAQLVFAGAGPQEDALRAEAARLGLAGDALFLGYRRDIPDVLAAVDALVITSLNEAMPLAAIEAMTAGIPIVSVPWNGSADLFEGGRLARIATDYAPEGLAREIATALDERDETAKQTERARKRALARYTLESCARRHARLYRELVAR